MEGVIENMENVKVLDKGNLPASYVNRIYSAVQLINTPDINASYGAKTILEELKKGKMQTDALYVNLIALYAKLGDCEKLREVYHEGNKKFPQSTEIKEAFERLPVYVKKKVEHNCNLEEIALKIDNKDIKKFGEKYIPYLICYEVNGNQPEYSN